MIGGGLTAEQQAVCRMVCFSQVNASGMAQTRRSLRRLRAKLGAGLPVLLGLWNVAGDHNEPQALAQEMDADEAVFSLGEALESVREHLGQPRRTPVPAPAAGVAPSAAASLAQGAAGA